MDVRQEKWLRDKLSWVFGFVQLEAEPFGEWPHWYKGTPIGVPLVSFRPHCTHRTVLMPDKVDEAPHDIDGWRFEKLIRKHSQEVMCPGREFGAHGDVLSGQAVEVPKYPTGTYWVCPYCEERVGNRHGKIRLDNVWVEAVYSKES